MNNTINKRKRRKKRRELIRRLVRVGAVSAWMMIACMSKAQHTNDVTLFYARFEDNYATTNILGHMTTRQKIDYAEGLRSIGYIGAAFDALCEAVEDLLPTGKAETPTDSLVLGVGVAEAETLTAEHLAEHGITLTNLVNALVSGGHVCAVIGHKWQAEIGIEGMSFIHQSKCPVCDKRRTGTEKSLSNSHPVFTTPPTIKWKED